MRRAKRNRYMLAHPESLLGDFEEADRQGFRLVAIKANGVLVYRTKSWIERLLRL